MIDRWGKSRSLLSRAKNSLPGGVNSGVRARTPVPLYFVDGCGSRLKDVDGNEYIDYSLAWGPLILGHRHPGVVEALRRQVERPHMYGAQHELEFQIAERLQAVVPCAERVVFLSSGTEAVQLALRLARAFTCRNLIVKFEGHYHGWVDSVFVSHHPTAEKAGDERRPNVVLGSLGQVPNSADNVLVLPWNQPDLLADAFREHGHEIAAVITEPVLCNSGCLMPSSGYLEAIYEFCKQYGALLIFDEVITGFRMSLGGAQEAFNIKPDIATFGKALSGGLPLSAVAGRKEIFDLMVHGGTVFGGTYNGNPISLAGAQGTLEELSRSGGKPLLHANRMGEMLISGIRDAARNFAIPLAVTGFGAAFSVHFTEKSDLRTYRDVLEDNLQRLENFVLGGLAEGLYLPADGRMYVSTVHQEKDIEETLRRIVRVFGSLDIQRDRTFS